MLRLLIILTAIKTVLLTDIDIFNKSLNPSKQFERIKNVPAKKYEIVRAFLKHYNSLKPVAVLVDDNEQIYEGAKEFMKSAFELSPSVRNITFIIFQFNATGVSAGVEIHGNRTQLEEWLDSSKGQSSYLGAKTNGSAAFFAILNAAATLPPNSAILMFTANKITDEDLASHTGILRRKNIKVYVIWEALFTRSGEERLLQELCAFSGGLFLANAPKNLTDYNYRLFLEKGNTHLNTSIILSKHELTGPSDFTFPIDSKVTDIHIRISPFVASGSLLTPTGHTIDILENDDIADYSFGSFGITQPGLYEVHLNVTTAPTQVIGFWRLLLNNTRVPYNVTVFVYSLLTVQAYFPKQTTRFKNSSGNVKNIMKLGISGHITSINNISFVNRDGQKILDSAKSTLVKDWLVIDDNVTHQNKEVDVEVINAPNQSSYALIQGKDSEGYDFARLAYVNLYNTNSIFPQPALSIEVGLGSELITTGGKLAVILFEVTNHKSNSVDVRFTCKDQNSLLKSLQPYRKIISPEETAIVRLTLITKYGSYQDDITFTAFIGTEQFQKKVSVDIGTQYEYDYEEPELDYTYSSDCSKVVLSSCEDGTWTIKIKAKDRGSGLLQLTTYPRGIYFPQGFDVGTKDEVVGYFSDSCCNPDLQIIATDKRNNRKIRNANAYLAFWGPAQIAALILGILFLILIIILIVYLIRKCIRGRENYDLPTYRGGRI